ncbi:CBS domain-containing protein [Bradyrhizobium canariense]|uniref:CBS domain-containing protein n=2 Tax=Bradyrhizobium canariense TaxID=255045 RepID=A0A1H1SYY8_9BRAD|nr:CBS domain-containing protein [Bradyrhizobium canariense]
MTRTVKTVTRDVLMRDLEKMFEADGFNAFPVRDNGDIVGLVTKFDFLNCFSFTPARMVPSYDDLMSKTVADVMTPEFIYVDAATRLPRVLQLMVEHRIKSLPILNAEQRLSGIISRNDVMRALAQCAQRPA